LGLAKLFFAKLQLFIFEIFFKKVNFCFSKIKNEKFLNKSVGKIFLEKESFLFIFIK
jgi:hypothetical protein